MEKLENEIVGSQVIKCEGGLDRDSTGYPHSLPVNAVILICSNGTS